MKWSGKVVRKENEENIEREVNGEKGALLILPFPRIR